MSALSARIITSVPSSPSSTARKRLRPSMGLFSSILASWPAQRAKSISRVSGRSMPGDDTSISYSPSIGSSVSMKSSSTWLSVVQPSTSMLPSGRSAITCSVLAEPPIMRKRTSLKPAFSITGSKTGSRCDAAAMAKCASKCEAMDASDKYKTFRPRRPFRTATQHVLLFGMARIYARKPLNTRLSMQVNALWGRCRR